MKSLLEQSVDQVLTGIPLEKETVLALAAWPEPEALWQAADRIREHFAGDFLSLCSIINARCGRCSEDCGFCAQSARYKTGVEAYDLIDSAEMMAIAEENNAHGVRRLSLVTSGRDVNMETLTQLTTRYQKMAEKTNFIFCGSMGLLTPAKAEKLHAAGLERYHCNLEASKKFFPTVCTTHTYEDKVETLRLAKEAGMSTCSGGIFGMGETMADRIDMAFELRDLAVDSIPLNILTPIAGTPMAENPPLSPEEILTSIACYRFVIPNKVIRIAGGRQLLAERQYQCFTAGANGAMVGNYLTTEGNTLASDIQSIRDLGYVFTKPDDTPPVG